MKDVTLLTLLVLVAPFGWGESSVYQFACDYPTYSNKTGSEIDQDFSFTLIVTESEDGSLTGVMSGNAGASSLVVALGAYGQIQFLETTSGGNWILTSVAPVSGKNEWPSVHSRHIWTGDKFITSQNFGACTVR